MGGLDDGNVAMIERVHHALVDGISGVEVAAALLDAEPEPAAIEVPPLDAQAGPRLVRPGHRRGVAAGGQPGRLAVAPCAG